MDLQELKQQTQAQMNQALAQVAEMEKKIAALTAQKEDADILIHMFDAKLTAYAEAEQYVENKKKQQRAERKAQKRKENTQ